MYDDSKTVESGEERLVAMVGGLIPGEYLEELPRSRGNGSYADSDC